jgi:hypothetical protein
MYCLVADLVRRQSLAVRQLLAWPLDRELPVDAVDAVRTLLRMQVRDRRSCALWRALPAASMSMSLHCHHV